VIKEIIKLISSNMGA
jgi:hypothetical protein